MTILTKKSATYLRKLLIFIVFKTRRDVACNVSTNGMAPGVYVLRLIDGDGVKTQKIVID